jgi:hypothetical protein
LEIRYWVLGIGYWRLEIGELLGSQLLLSDRHSEEPVLSRAEGTERACPERTRRKGSD